MNRFLSAFFHPLPQAMLSVSLGVLGAAGYASVHAPPLCAAVTTVVVAEVQSPEDPAVSLQRVVVDLMGGSHWGTMPRPEGKDAATIIVGNSNERLRFVSNDGRTIALCACVTYEDALEDPRMQRDCKCTPNSVLATEPP